MTILPSGFLLAFFWKGFRETTALGRLLNKLRLRHKSLIPANRGAHLMAMGLEFVIAVLMPLLIMRVAVSPEMLGSSESQMWGNPAVMAAIICSGILFSLL